MAFESTGVQFELDMSYPGQTHTVGIPLPVDLANGKTGVTTQTILDAFTARYREVYGRPLEGIAIRVLNLRVCAIGRRPKFDLTLLAPKDGVALADAKTGTRQVWFDGAFRKTGIYDRLPLSIGTRVPGPAILEQPDATICIEPDLQGKVDRFGNLVISRKENVK